MRQEIHPQAAVAPGYLENHAARVFNRVVDARLRQNELTLALLGPLLLLAWQGSMLHKDLVRHSAVRQPAMVALLDKQESAGHIRREAVAVDRRAAMVFLTPSGDRVAAIGREVLMDVNALDTNGFARQESDVLVASLSRLIQNLEMQRNDKHHAMRF